MMDTRCSDCPCRHGVHCRDYSARQQPQVSVQESGISQNHIPENAEKLESESMEKAMTNPTIAAAKEAKTRTLLILIREFGGIDSDADVHTDADAIRWMENYEGGLLQTLRHIADEINKANQQQALITQLEAEAQGVDNEEN